MITVLALVTVQAVLACVWRLVTMVRRGTVFSHVLAQAVARDVEATRIQAELDEVI